MFRQTDIQTIARSFSLGSLFIVVGVVSCLVLDKPPSHVMSEYLISRFDDSDSLRNVSDRKGQIIKMVAERKGCINRNI